MLGVGQGDNVDLFSSSWDYFLTIPPHHPNPSLAHPHCLSLVKGGVLYYPLVEHVWGFSQRVFEEDQS